MSRAEERALEVYPRSEKYTTSQRLIVNDLRDGFIQGYEQAQNDFLEKAKAWLDDNAFEYVKTKNFSIYELYDTYDSDALLSDFEKAMTEEK